MARCMSSDTIDYSHHKRGSESAGGGGVKRSTVRDQGSHFAAEKQVQDPGPRKQMGTLGQERKLERRFGRRKDCYAVLTHYNKESNPTLSLLFEHQPGS
ncbi:hypothetical protein AOXY_G19900 [Acipenser oxyrinchus oxyrinchus]|uniref:Uncharacterized protein n=1 Tax=Acipenser oxyrinchus oxyrinchus TaxID=40147 RepID=A0AAD8G2V5_ACIOX|nr:hypothetical protein AOXY_G19900 [Acipenser oxyrinchus oxyrinchus]